MTCMRPSRRSLACLLSGLLGVGLVVLFAFSASRADEAGVSQGALPPEPGGGLVAGQPLTLPFPRLGMWWPDPWTQPITDIARYDWVILGRWESEFITPLKMLNPDIIVLNSTNACEVSFDPDHDINHWSNARVRDVPPEWFLTQVGSVLVTDVDTTTTVFQVAAITATDGSEVYDLFIPGDAVLIEGESVLVESVDAAAKTLTVERGYVRPASSHSAGTRLAAHITFWPGSWLVNLSTMCPLATVSTTVGAETWGQYHARYTSGLLDDVRWDGLLIDRSDPDQSWLIGNSTARTIDPDQSNTLITDYAAFDAAWNAGLLQYEADVRATVGDDRIIFVNWGMANYDLLNGNNFEGFPMDDATIHYGVPWRTMVFGPTEGGSYFEWMAQAQQPNLTMIETYEEDGGPDPAGSGEYENPCDDPGFVPDYRKMRFGLATALLNNGFFSYEINTNGHGSLCLLWFDEYDNAGAGRDYLGLPLGPVTRAVSALTTPNLIGGGGFETPADLDLWDLWADTGAGYAATVALDGSTAVSGASSARVDVQQAQGTDWRVSFSLEPLDVTSGTEYTLSFWGKADQLHPIWVWVEQAEDPWETYVDFGSVSLTTTWQHFEISGLAAAGDAQAVFLFGLGRTTGSVWLDDVWLQVGNREVWRRDYEGGVVLVNATAATQTVPLGGEFFKINGTQAPAVNDGSLVTQVDLPPADGLILLRSDLYTHVYLPLVSLSDLGDFRR